MAAGFAAVDFLAVADLLAVADFLAVALPAADVFLTAVVFFAVDLPAAGLAAVARTADFAAADSAGETRLAEGLAVRLAERVVVVFADVERAPDLAVAFGADAVLADGLAAADLVPAGRDADADLLAAGRTDVRSAAPGLVAPGFAAEADLAGAADLEVAALEATDFADALEATDFAVAALEATGFDADFVAVDFAPVFAVAGFDAAVVPVFFDAVAAGFRAAGLPAAAPVAFFCDAAGLAAVVVLGARAAGGGSGRGLSGSGHRDVPPCE